MSYSEFKKVHTLKKVNQFKYKNPLQKMIRLQLYSAETTHWVPGKDFLSTYARQQSQVRSSSNQEEVSKYNGTLTATLGECGPRITSERIIVSTMINEFLLSELRLSEQEFGTQAAE